MHATDEIDYQKIRAQEGYPPVRIVLPGATDRHGMDAMYIHDAVITEPHHNSHVTIDTSSTRPGRVYVITVRADVSQRPYIAALNNVGIIVTSRHGDIWHGYQTRPLPL